MFQIGDRVIINPDYSIAFANKEGTIVGFDQDLLPIKVQFSKDSMPFKFAYFEIIKRRYKN